jgi:hypothetical protein
VRNVVLRGYPFFLHDSERLVVSQANRSTRNSGTSS